MLQVRTSFLATLAMVLLLTEAGYTGRTEHGGRTIHLDNAWSRRAPMLGQEGQGGSSLGNGAVYVRISNHGSAPDALLSAATDVATTVELHQTVAESGKMVMRPLPRFDIPAGGNLKMKPGGYHIMLLGLKRDLQQGEMVNVTLTFEKGGQMSVEALVK
jgi:periplasmic copper chaperone A